MKYSPDINAKARCHSTLFHVWDTGVDLKLGSSAQMTTLHEQETMKMNPICAVLSVLIKKNESQLHLSDI